MFERHLRGEVVPKWRHFSRHTKASLIPRVRSSQAIPLTSRAVTEEPEVVSKEQMKASIHAAFDSVVADGAGYTKVYAAEIRQKNYLVFCRTSVANFTLAATPLMAVIAAIPEETIFRGILQPTLQAKVGRWPGVALTAAIFSVFHVQFQFALPLLLSHFCWGLILGLLRERTGTLWAPAIAHMLVWIVLGAI